MAYNLTNLTNVKNWIGSPAGSGMSAGDDATLNRLIAAASAQIMTYIGRQTIFKNNVTNDTYNGNGQKSMLIMQWPVITLNSVYVSNVLIPPATNNTDAGWLLMPWDGFSAGRPQQLGLNGYLFATPVGCGDSYYGGGAPYNSGFTRNSNGLGRPIQNVILNYICGYMIQNEAAGVIPATPYQLTAAQPNGTWGQDDGLTIAGVAGVPVASGPTTGQYSVANGVYTFAAADTGKAVVLNYSYIPSDLEQACIEIVSEKYSYKSRIGQKTKSLIGNETASFNLAGMTDSVRMLLKPYKSWIIKR